MSDTDTRGLADIIPDLGKDQDTATRDYARGYAAGRQADAHDIGQATDAALARYRHTHMPDDDLIATTLEHAENIALRKDTP